MGSEKIYSPKEPSKLAFLQFSSLARIHWPWKFILSEFLLPEAKSGFIPIKNFYLFSAFPGKQKKSFGKWIHAHVLFDKYTQGRYGFAHIRKSGADKDTVTMKVSGKHVSSKTLKT